ncbi:6-pyruvoyl tetrahydropterin synthase family protein [Halomicrobium sp. IBSBa]|uniref:6-carboxy-5,6,7,8-tetrahydropterin synthase n=1 Tax=Halomicrobium mukohataei TaxID=57705 RepID=A0A847U8G7_9EURY|nr:MULTISPECIES: 6-pyruvoyl tetrahydropterin synthase family protein [Halomicrobium]MBO4249439.1 6-pyruvoyl tetrahydropterin synthase family protein [Halomicrobium sp. IBSBa]NLV08846.1 6-carboxy-5,6,7,8-tetrahydropterin synthase [Halomicrobium mukohataei]
MAEGLSTERSDAIADAGERELVVGGDRPIRISTGHRIMHHDGKCSRPHGHNYEVTVRVTGALTAEGWVVDKGDVTDAIDDWDHRFLVEAGDPLVDAFERSGDGDALVVLDHPPTAEVMAIVLEERLAESLPDTVSDVGVTVRETGELAAGP